MNLCNPSIFDVVAYGTGVITLAVVGGFVFICGGIFIIEKFTTPKKDQEYESWFV